MAASAQRTTATLRALLRIALFSSPLLVTWVPGRLGYVAALAMMAVVQLASTLLTALRQQSAQEELYRRVGTTLARASAMTPLPLPEAEPELALGRALYARARLDTEIVPAIHGEAVGIIVALAVVVASPLRVLLVPLAGGVVVAIAAYLPLYRAASARMRVQFEAAERLHRHVVQFLLQRQELIAQGATAAFLRTLDTRATDFRVTALRGAGSNSLVRRVPLALSIAAAWGLGESLHLDIPVDAARVLFALAVLQGVGALFSAFAERRRLELDASPLDAVLSLKHDAPDGEAAPANCARIEARDLSFTYDGGSAVLDRVSFVIAPAKPLVLRGENGSGKSTLVRLIAGLAPPTRGSILVDGVDLATLSADAYRARVAFVPQAHAFDPNVTVREAMRAIDSNVAERAMIESLEAIGFADPKRLLDREMGALSSGQQRRVQVARAFAIDRSIMLLDEPEAGLDAASQRRLRDLIARASQSKIVVIATHSDLFDEGLRLDPRSKSASAPAATNAPAAEA